jgi:GT2 family glycosyltransferase
LYLTNIFPRLVQGRFYDINHRSQEAVDVPWLQGSCLLMRRDLYEQIGGFDPQYFLYVEDVDLCYRIREQGFHVVYLPAATVTHIGASSTTRATMTRVRGYHISPLYFFATRHQPGKVFALKLLFTIELSLKAALRWMANLFRRSVELAEHYRVEWHVLKEVWSYRMEGQINSGDDSAR